MSNKLKEIFSDKLFDMGGKIHFQDHESYKKFLQALQIVQDEGRAVELDGVSSFTTEIKDGEIEYPLIEHDNITQFIVAPSIEDVPIDINTEYGEKKILFKCFQNTKEIILETDENEIVYFKMVFTKDKDSLNDTFTIAHRAQPQNAKTIKAIVESYNTAISFLNKIFELDRSEYLSEGDALPQEIKENLQRSELFFKKLYLVEQELKVSFEPTQVNDAISDKLELEELYLLIVEKKAIRLNVKLNATETTGITMQPAAPVLEVGSLLDITFIRNLEYIVFDEKIHIHTANLLSNAIIQEVKEEKDGTIKVLYGDTDSQPMYISYTGFKTTDEASQELEVIMDHKEVYRTALTVDEHIKESYVI